jgi:predicted lactoylglutathione lyase
VSGYLTKQCAENIVEAIQGLTEKNIFVILLERKIFNTATKKQFKIK